MEAKLQVLKQEALAALESITDLQALEQLDKTYFGRKEGKLNTILKSLKDLSSEEKAVIGPLANTIKGELQIAFEGKKAALENAELEQQLATEKIDVTLPGIPPQKGSLHPLTQILDECIAIFESLGFTCWDGPEIDSDYHNFQAVNIPEHHPARDMQDTFFLDEGCVLRTQTSAMQNRVLRNSEYPIRAIIPGRVFRNEATDASHDVQFYQLEGIMVDKNISIANLINILKTFLKALFGKEIKFRIRPGYFPFVEPGLELDMSCLLCEGNGCAMCKYSGWSEVMPCGMIHPNVLKEAGIDSNEYTGFAFGFGITRLAVMKYGIEDVRHLNSGDLRFLRQF